MVTRRDYNAEQVQAAKSVLLELGLVLGEYRDKLVLVGGWAPVFLIPDPVTEHVGSVDVDLAVDHSQVTEDAYATIEATLLQRGYERVEQNQFSFRKKVGDVVVQVDLLSGEYGGTGKGHRHQVVQETKLRKARGCDLVFDDPESIRIEGELPDGAKDSIHIQVASIGAFLSMKGHALAGRLKEKDAWDIVYCIREYPGGMDALVDEIRPIIQHGLAREGLEKIAEHFASVSHRGPSHVADFDLETDTEARATIQRDAYERVSYVLRELGILDRDS